MAQRYYQTYPVSSLYIVSRYPNVALSGGSMSPSFIFPVEMRTTPSGNNTSFQWDTWSASGSYTGVLQPILNSKSVAWLYSSTNNSGTLLAAGFFGASNTTALTLSAEL
jgi:hypothetical protein